MSYWPQQLNLAAWCARTGLGISREVFDKVSEQNVQSDTDYAALSFKRICAEFGISSGIGFRFEEGDNHGLGSVFIYVLITNSEIRVEKPSKAI